MLYPSKEEIRQDLSKKDFHSYFVIKQYVTECFQKETQNIKSELYSKDEVKELLNYFSNIVSVCEELIGDSFHS